MEEEVSLEEVRTYTDKELREIVKKSSMEFNKLVDEWPPEDRLEAVRKKFRPHKVKKVKSKLKLKPKDEKVKTIKIKKFM